MLAVVTTLHTASHAQSQNLVTNPSFELPGLPPEPGFIYLDGNDATFMTGWTVETDGAHESSFVYRQTHYPATTIIDGEYVLVLNDGDSLAASVPTTVGMSYVWSFGAYLDDGGGQRLRAGNVDGVFRPARDGYGIGLFDELGEWRRFPVVFTAVDSTTVFRIDDLPQDRPYAGIHLDAVRIVPCIDVMVPPRNVARCGTSEASFSVIVAGTPPFTYRWEWRPVGRATWVPLVDSVNTYEGQMLVNAHSTSSPACQVRALPGIGGNFQLRCVVGSNCGGTVSDEARLTVNTADFDNDGDIGTDADIEAFFACLSGRCCVNCGTADFNGDDDTGTDADIESFFRVLAGGAC